jgi:hypothetical protein
VRSYWVINQSAGADRVSGASRRRAQNQAPATAVEPTGGIRTPVLCGHVGWCRVRALHHAQGPDRPVRILQARVHPAIVIRGAGDRVDIDDVAHLAEALAGVRRTEREGLAEWRYHGRLVARQLDDVHVVIRADFDYRDSILRQSPGTFSVPAPYIKHMMVVADLEKGDSAAIADALEAAWELQRRSD